MLKVLKVKHISLYIGDFDAILVLDDRNPADFNACDLCIFKGCPSSDCSKIHDCYDLNAYWNTYWLLGACTADPKGEANPNGRHVDV